MVASFWADMDIRDGGCVFYRETIGMLSLQAEHNNKYTICRARQANAVYWTQNV